MACVLILLHYCSVFILALRPFLLIILLFSKFVFIDKLETSQTFCWFNCKFLSNQSIIRIYYQGNIYQPMAQILKKLKIQTVAYRTLKTNQHQKSFSSIYFNIFSSYCHHFHFYFYKSIIFSIPYNFMDFILSLLVAFLATLFILYVAVCRKIDKEKRNKTDYYELTVMLGSGGHTGEMCQLLSKLNFTKINKLNILITKTDQSSANYLQTFLIKNLHQQVDSINSKMVIHYINRTNQVKQSYLSSIKTTLLSTLSLLMLIYSQLLNTTHFLANGPGTCVPIYFIFYLLKKIKICRINLVFFQSWCRVKSLSLTGKLVRPIVDRFVVHWQQLKIKYKNVDFYGNIL